ncbi:MAG: hypothetical protein DIU63_13140 [Proteobacteria bacterium]|jgi:methyltransferase, FkbM family|nr:MAG: hypothetical protein DIU63_13140 [Pseudomonadota bacterium]
MARAIDRATGLIGAKPRLRGLALRALLDRHLAPGTLCLVPFGDHALYVNPRDDKMSLKLMAGRCWQRRELEAAIFSLQRTRSLKRNCVFIDVGANIGVHSIYAMNSGAFSRAIAIEPEPNNFSLLERNIRLNGLEKRIAAIKAAASARGGELQLMRHRRNFGAHSVERTFAKCATDAVTVAALSLDEILAQQGISVDEVGLVKIDVEGHELAVLEGMRELREARVPIMVELTVDRDGSDRLQRFKALLAPYYEHVLDLADEAEGFSAPIPLPELSWRASQVDLLIC